jgi:hypothetical protein
MKKRGRTPNAPDDVVKNVKNLLQGEMRKSDLLFEDSVWIDRDDEDQFPTLWHLVAALYPPQYHHLEYKVNLDDNTFHIPDRFIPLEKLVNPEMKELEIDWDALIEDRDQGRREAVTAHQLPRGLSEGVELYETMTDAHNRRQVQFLSVDEALGYNVAMAEYEMKRDMGAKLTKILLYCDAAVDLVDALRDQMLTAEEYNKKMLKMSVAQIACGTAALALGITIIVITAGAGTPVVALGIAATASGVTAGAVESKKKIAKAERDQRMPTKRLSHQRELVDANEESYMKVIRKGKMVKDEIFDPKDPEIMMRNQLILKGGAATTSVGVGIASDFAGGYGAVVTGPKHMYSGAFSGRDAMAFSSHPIYQKFRQDSADAVIVNLNRFLHSMKRDNIELLPGIVRNWLLDDANNLIVERIIEYLHKTIVQIEKLNTDFDKKKKREEQIQAKKKGKEKVNGNRFLKQVSVHKLEDLPEDEYYAAQQKEKNKAKELKQKKRKPKGKKNDPEDDL